MKEIFMSGFYFDKNNIEKKLRNYFFDDVFENNESPIDTLYVFLQGACDIFAESLNKKFGYPIYKISNKHYYCKAKKDNEIYYIDVRGITNDFEIFKNSLFDSNVDLQEEILVENEDFSNEHYEEASYYSNIVINEHPEWYDLNMLKTEKVNVI